MSGNTLDIDSLSVCASLEKFIDEKTRKLGRKGIIVGLSGGIDSAVVAALTVRAVGQENVLCLFLPEKHTASESEEHARLVTDSLGTQLKVKNLSSMLNQFGSYKLIPSKFPPFLTRKALKLYSKNSDEAELVRVSTESAHGIGAKASALLLLKHRMRMLTIYYYAEQRNLLVAGAANKTEILTGLYCLYGCDHAADIMPLAGLYKTQVRQIAEFLKVPPEVIKKPPSPDLFPGITDEILFGIPYENLDLILYGLEQEQTAERISKEGNFRLSDVTSIQNLTQKLRYKREVPFMPFE